MVTDTSTIQFIISFWFFAYFFAPDLPVSAVPSFKKKYHLHDHATPHNITLRMLEPDLDATFTEETQNAVPDSDISANTTITAVEAQPDQPDHSVHPGHFQRFFYQRQLFIDQSKTVSKPDLSNDTWFDIQCCTTIWIIIWLD